jgi:hypothetical protein
MHRQAGTFGLDTVAHHLLCIDVAVQPQVVVVNSLPYTMHVCLSPADSSNDDSAADDAAAAPAPVFSGIIPSGSRVSVNAHVRQSLRISLRADTIYTVTLTLNGVVSASSVFKVSRLPPVAVIYGGDSLRLSTSGGLISAASSYDPNYAANEQPESAFDWSCQNIDLSLSITSKSFSVSVFNNHLHCDGLIFIAVVIRNRHCRACARIPACSHYHRFCSLRLPRPVARLIFSHAFTRVAVIWDDKWGLSDNHPRSGFLFLQENYFGV